MVSPREISWQPSALSAIATWRTCSGATGPSNGQLKAVETYPRTGTGDAAMTGANRSSVSAIDPLVFLREKVSLAAVNTATTSTRAATARSSPLKIGHQRVVSHALPALDPLEHLFRVGELGNPFRRDEAGYLDVRQPCLRQGIDVRHLQRSGHELADALQPVPRPHLHQSNHFTTSRLSRPRVVSVPPRQDLPGDTAATAARSGPANRAAAVPRSLSGAPRGRARAAHERA